MRDPFSWSLPLVRLAGITVRIHILFFLFVIGMWLRFAVDKDLPIGSGTAMLVLLGLIFVSVLLHEFGHCIAARMVDGDANDILLWPLGGLARCDVPHTPRANFITAAGGPAVNLLLCVLAGSVLAANSLLPPLNPLPTQAFVPELYDFSKNETLVNPFPPFRNTASATHVLEYWHVLVAQFFWVNWFGLLINIFLMGFPLDGGQMLQAALWPRMGYRQSMHTAIFVGFVVVLVLVITAIVLYEPLILLLAYFIYRSCQVQWVQLETGGEDGLFGYDFSQGYTSLEQEEHTQVKRKQPNFFQRWFQKRKAQKMQKQMERQEADERRMDELLEKIQRLGKESLTDEENRFLKRVSDRYRNRP